MFSAFFRSLKQEFAGYNSKKLLADMMALSLIHIYGDGGVCPRHRGRGLG